MLLIYITAITSRLRYITEVLFSCVLHIGFEITTSPHNYTAYDGPKINYSEKRIKESEIWIKPRTLLFENSITQQDIRCFEWGGMKAFFATDGDISFDVFAAAFYLVTRYEEYLPHEKDEYGRYSHKNSTAFKQGFLHLPMVNMWMKELKKMLDLNFTSFAIGDSPLTIHHSPFTFAPTYDIDIAYSYKGKSLLRNLGGFLKDTFAGNWRQLTDRICVRTSLGDDPFDTYNWLDELHKKYSLKPVYFFLLAEKNKLYDKNISPRSAAMQRLIKKTSQKYATGIHPSWQSGDDENLLVNEINTLAAATGKPVSQSRQHYIRMNVPGTYRVLIEKGILEDYSMGYGSINGFRASIASPFYWYDLENEVKTNLLIRPFCYMEANSFFEQHYTAEQAAAELQAYHDIVKLAGGELITIFHNHFITLQPQWIEWRNMYAEFLQWNFG